MSGLGSQTILLKGLGGVIGDAVKRSDCGDSVMAKGISKWKNGEIGE